MHLSLPTQKHVKKEELQSLKAFNNSMHGRFYHVPFTSIPCPLIGLNVDLFGLVSHDSLSLWFLAYVKDKGGHYTSPWLWSSRDKSSCVMGWGWSCNL